MNSSVRSHCSFHNTLTLPISAHGHTTVLYNFPPHFPTHVTVQLNTHCIMSLYVLFCSQYCTCRYDLFHCHIKLFTVYICSLFLFVIFLSQDIRFATPHLVLPLFNFQSPLFKSPLNRHNNMSSPPISCLSTLLIYRPCSTLLSHFIFTDSPIFLLPIEYPPFLFHCYLLIGLIILHSLLLFYLMISYFIDRFCDF